MKKALICDLDGTLRTTLNGKTFAKHPRDYQIIPGIDKKLNQFLINGWKIHGVSNQGGIAAGHKSIEECVHEMFYTMDLIPQLASILFCPDFAGEKCFEISRMNIYYIKNLQNISNKYPNLIGKYRKPKPGMLEAILIKENMHQPFDEDELLMVGDRPEDEGAAKAINAPFMWAADWLKK